MAQYGKAEYWEDRYQKDKEQFDWYQRYSGLKDIITQYVQPTYQILNVGAGNSRKLHSHPNHFHSAHNRTHRNQKCGVTKTWAEKS